MSTYSSWGLRWKETWGHGRIKIVLERAVVSDAAIGSSDGANIFDGSLRTSWESRGRGGDLWLVHNVEMERSDGE